MASVREARPRGTRLMALTTNFADCQRFAAAVASAGGEVPPILANLLQAHDVLSRTRPPEEPILDAALAGELDDKALAKLLPVAATAAMCNQYRRQLASESEHVLLGEWHRQVKGGCADEILNSMRERFDEHAKAIEKARSLISPESSAEAIIESGQPELVTAWQGLNGHLAVISRIAAVASQFGPRLGSFPQISEYPNADNFRLVDAALMCADGASLELDSAPFHQADRGQTNGTQAVLG
jgi:hypothetical protein